MVVTRIAVAPGRADAERAAEVLADAGVASVVLFGSVARGKATEHSDIDLLAIYDDLDYQHRWEKRQELSSLAETASGYPVDLVVSDRAEWKVRTERVHTSLESRAARFGVVLADRPAIDVDWGKEMVMPVNDYQEALYRLGLAANALRSLRRQLEPDSIERIERETGNEIRAFDEYLVRLLRAAGEAHAVVEASIKSLIHLEAAPVAEPWGHDIARLCNQLSHPHRRSLPPLLAPHGAAAVSQWHVLASYQAEGRGPTATPKLVTELAQTACAVVTYTADQFNEPSSTVDTIRVYVAYVTDYLDGYDLATGESRTGSTTR